MRPLPLLIAVVLASGCASWAKKGVSVTPPRKVRVAILPLELDFKLKAPSDVETVVSSATLTADERRQAVEALESQLRRRLADSFAVRLSSSYVFEPVPAEDVERALVAAGVSTGTAPTAGQYEALARAAGADAVLRLRVHGYGRVKRTWLWALWGGSFVEGGSQGVVVAEAAGSVWAAAGVAAEEVAQEGAEWFGGGYAFNRYYAPVILEGDLYSGTTGRNLWGRWFVVTENKKAVKALPKAQQRLKEVRLRLTFETARDRLVKKLERAALAQESSALQ